MLRAGIQVLVARLPTLQMSPIKWPAVAVAVTVRIGAFENVMGHEGRPPNCQLWTSMSA